MNKAIEDSSSQATAPTPDTEMKSKHAANESTKQSAADQHQAHLNREHHMNKMACTGDCADSTPDTMK